MNRRTLQPGVEWLGAQDWNRRLFDALIPLPDGTSYNAYLVRGETKTVLLDTADPSVRTEFMEQLSDIPRIDAVVSHHAEPDHSGLLPDVLSRFPEAKVLCTPKARNLLMDLLPIAGERIQTVQDGEVFDLGGRSLRMIHLPWSHWPETMGTFLVEDRLLFSCDLFGAHLATSSLFAGSQARWLECAKLYYAQIFMPYAPFIRKNLDKVIALDPLRIAPSHGPVVDEPARILRAYRGWLDDPPRRLTLVARVSMHGSTAALADRLISELIARGMDVEVFDLTAFATDRFAAALVDASTLVIAAPAVWNGIHPLALTAVALTNGLRPKLRHIVGIGSYGWSSKALEDTASLFPGLKAEILPPVLCRGRPGPEALAAVTRLAEQIASI
jgi:flavorubredoxin